MINRQKPFLNHSVALCYESEVSSGKSPILFEMNILTVLLTARSFRLLSARSANANTPEGPCWYYLVLTASARPKANPTDLPACSHGGWWEQQQGLPVKVTFAATSS